MKSTHNPLIRLAAKWQYRFALFVYVGMWFAGTLFVLLHVE